MVKTVSHFQSVTGLKEARAKECFDACGCYEAALASFVQSFASIPKDFFDGSDVVKKNAAQINEELRVIYRRARELKAELGKSDADVWKEYSENHRGNTATPTLCRSPPAAVPPANTASVLGEAPKTSIFPAPTGGISFGFGQPAAAPAIAFKAFNTASVLGEAPKTSIFPAPAGGISFGFGQPAAASNDTAEAVKPDASIGASEPDAEAAPQKEKVPVKYCEATHFTGPFFEMPLFWEEEVVAIAPLLNLNNGFLEGHKDELRPKMEKWVAKASFYRKPIQYVEIEDKDEEVIRVIIKDADRTFFHPEHRAKMVAFLTAMYYEFNAYGQAMSYFAGLCMLVLTEDETAAVIRLVSTEYIKGHWAAEAVGFATSAWVVEYFMKKLQPDVASHLEKLNFWPDTYLQKILTGLCIHVLQFSDLFIFLDAFMQGGLPYLIRFSLALVEHFRRDLLAIKTSTEANNMYSIMRLDPQVTDHSDIIAILARAPSIDLGDDAYNIDVIRSEVYNKRIEPRLKRAPKTDTFEPCELCEKKRPKWWNNELGAICDDCKAQNPKMEYEKF